ncbi:type I-C CRISPR-associated protein Cas8c/Csd1 [Verrucomicrobium sp. 3C]|uniref:type I-C CRISPR-associated protein Cas8c/Csd1 n=1 Tax=Verrucomicrobium sp. 3C TaxID=1134055 RepID=UPI00037BCFDD|nr:type I-C CRISPR-associated protein Cas8c/Csd1 [Verrucomicrobium sp. 3C]
MSFLASLADAYDRLPDADKPPFGFSWENIGIIVGLNEDGSVANVTDWRKVEGNKKHPQSMLVPQRANRTSGISPNTFWDNTAYALGVTAKNDKHTAKKHDAFVRHHIDILRETTDPGLLALRRFLERWTPDQFVPPLWQDDIKDQNVVFALESDRLKNIRMHDRPAAKALLVRVAAKDKGNEQICLVTGQRGPVARLHPLLKGVWDAQPSGASLVSFNLPAFASYGHDQGDNAPVSEVAAFAYTAALNRFLERDSGHRVQIGDATTVFWADASSAEAEKVENLFAAFFDPKTEETAAAAKMVGIQLERIRKGELLKDVEPKLADNVRFYVLGLAPNAARLSIRFYFENDFGVLAANYQRYIEDMRIEPPPAEPYPPLQKYLLELAVLGEHKNIPPNLAGEWMRAILFGTHYPLTMMSGILMRIRADGKVNALRASMLKAVLNRNYKKEAPVAFDPDNRNRGYLLGRLFAVYEYAQTKAIGTKANSTIKDKFYGGASAQPRKVFALLERGSANHLSKIGKESPALRIYLEERIAAIMAKMNPGGDPFPTSLPVEDQALFGLGYYHQRNEFFKKVVKTADTRETTQ